MMDPFSFCYLDEIKNNTFNNGGNNLESPFIVVLLRV